MKRFLAGFFTALGLLTGGALFVVYAGWINVAASAPHTALGRWFFETAMRRSVEVRADNVGQYVPEDANRVKRGAQHFAQMCVVCHGAPGVERGEIGKGLRPEPPDLVKAVPQWTPRELYWIVKHGIKMTGMPASGQTHGDEALWDIVAFLGRMPQMSADEYAAMSDDKQARGADAHTHQR